MSETCWLCGQTVGVNKDGELRQHRIRLADGPRGRVRLGPNCVEYFGGGKYSPYENALRRDRERRR